MKKPARTRASRKAGGPAPVSQLRRIDQLCDLFEKGWKNGLRPRIEDYLEGAASEERAELLCQLVGIEVEVLAAAGQPVDRRAYKQRFPHDWASLRDLFPRANRERPARKAPADAELAAPVSVPLPTDAIVPRVTLEVIEGPHQGARFEFSHHDTFLAGRASGAHLRLANDPHFSRHHFRIEVNPPQCYLVDLGSRNGTFVNNQRVRDTFLSNGDLVSGGHTVLQVTISDPAPVPAAAPPASDAAPKAPGDAWQAFRNLAKPADTPPEIAGYDLHEELGRGAMGCVYRATHQSTRRECAVKLLIPAQVASEKALQMFIREAGIHTRLEHPRIVKSHEMGLSGGHVFLAMEFVRHRPFEDLVQNVSSGTRRRAACVIACQVLEALAYAHERGLVHRDVKPENVLLSRSGRKLVSKLADFGLAKKYTDAGFSQISRDGDVAGSLPFMPPEQLIDSRHAKPGCDIYGLGATLYWYLSGTTPHDFTESRCRFLTVLEDPIVPLVERCPQTPAELSRIIDRALAREPAERFTSATEMRRAMVRWAGEK